MPADLQALKQEAERRINEWATTGHGLVSSSLYEACAWFSTGLGDHHTHDAQIGFFACGYNTDIWLRCLRVDTDQYFDDASKRLAADAESIIVLANPVQPHSEGEIVLESANPTEHPAIRTNYFGDPHDMKVMVSVIRRTLDIVAHWPAHRTIGPLLIPPFLARKHGHFEGTVPTDALLEDSRISLCVDRLSRNVDVPDWECRRSTTPGGGGPETARGGRERHAERGERQHECGVDHDRREGGGDAGRRSWHKGRRVRRRASRQAPLIPGSR